MSSMRRRGKKGIFTIYYRDIDNVQHMKSTGTTDEKQAKRIKEWFDAEMQAEKKRLKHLRKDQDVIEVVQAMLKRPVNQILNSQLIEAEPHIHNMTNQDEYEDEWEVKRNYEEQQQQIANQRKLQEQHEREKKLRIYNTFNLEHIEIEILAKNIRNLRDNSINAYRYQLAALKDLGINNLLEFNRDKQLLNKYIDHNLNNMKLKPSSINQKIRYMKAIFSHVCSYYNYDNVKNPFAPYKKMKESKPKYTILPNSELIRWIAHFEREKEHGMMFLFLFAGFCGLRRNELRHIKSTWIDIESKKIIIPDQDEKFESKSHSARIIPMSDIVMKYILKYKPEGRITGSAAYSKFGQFKKKYKWNFKIHDLRHSYACNLLRDNVPVLKIKSYLGHSSYSETERYLSGLSQYFND